MAGLAAVAQAQSAPAGNMSALMQKMRMKVERMTPQRAINASTAVGGVRGAAVASSDVYWKGEEKPQPVNAEELEAFQKNMALVDAGKVDEAKTAFADFVKTYPQSPLKGEAGEVLAMLDQPAAAAPDAAPAAAAPVAEESK
jgi:TolA-binding protein